MSANIGNNAITSENKNELLAVALEDHINNSL